VTDARHRRFAIESATSPDASARLQRLTAEVDTVTTSAAQLRRLTVEVLSPSRRPRRPVTWLIL